MKIAIALGSVATVCLLVACSDGATTATTPASGNAEAARTGSSKQALYTYSDSGTTFNCSSLNQTVFGSSSDNYDPTNSGSSQTIYAFLKLAKTHADTDVINAGMSDYSHSAEDSQADLASALSTIDSLNSFLAAGPYNATNLSAAEIILEDLTSISQSAQSAAVSAMVSALYNYGVTTGPNEASYVTILARKAAELANQGAADATYCALLAGNRQVPNGASYVNMACSNVP